MLFIYFLNNSKNYEDSIKKILLKGGDTDTNCKIVGNLLGSIHGINKIPKYMIKQILNFNCILNMVIRDLNYIILKNFIKN